MKRIAILAIFVISGCSTSAVSPSKASLAPADRVFKYQHATPLTSELFIIRDEGIVGSGCYTAIFIDGERVAILEAKEKSVFYINPGEHAIGASFEGKGLCSMGNGLQERYFSFVKGEAKFLRVYTDGNANIDIKPTTIK